MAKIENEADRNAWRILLRSKNVHPDAEIHSRLGRDWARVRALNCPICGAAFYGWQCLPAPLPPNSQKDPHDGYGMRITCGDPDCHEFESAAQNLKNQRKYLSTCTLETEVQIPSRVRT